VTWLTCNDADVTRVLVRAAPVVSDPALLDRLDDSERERAARKVDPTAYITAHVLLRELVGEILDRDPASLSFAKRCLTCGSARHGKPTVVDSSLSISVSYGDRLALAAATEGPPLGVDVEEIGSADFKGFNAVTLDPQEELALFGLTGPELLHARARMWARKEALLKATGHGLVVDPTQVVVSGPSEPAELLSWNADQPAPSVTALADVDLPEHPDHEAALAVLVPGPLEVIAV
jgi:4'-phosphopantetheinyl transferase